MISEELKRLCENIHSQGDGAPEEAGPYVTVEQLTGRFGVLYEKLRSLVDYKEQHVIRQSAIRRMLKRQLYLERKPNSGSALLRELVSSGYLPNNKVRSEGDRACRISFASGWRLNMRAFHFPLT